MLLASAALLLFIAVLASPLVLRPSIVSDGPGDSSDGSSRLLARQHQVLTTILLTPSGWPNVGVQSVGDVPGARVAGAWVIDEASAKSETGTDPVDHTTGLDYLRANFPDVDLGAASRLPHRIGAGEPAQLFILWDITDCALLIEGHPTRPRVELTSIPGTSTHQKLPDWAAPGFGLKVPGEPSTCPAP